MTPSETVTAALGIAGGFVTALATLVNVFNKRTVAKLKAAGGNMETSVRGAEVAYKAFEKLVEMNTARISELEESRDQMRAEHEEIADCIRNREQKINLMEFHILSIHAAYNSAVEHIAHMDVEMQRAFPGWHPSRFAPLKIPDFNVELNRKKRTENPSP